MLKPVDGSSSMGRSRYHTSPRFMNTWSYINWYNEDKAIVGLVMTIPFKVKVSNYFQLFCYVAINTSYNQIYQS